MNAVVKYKALNPFNVNESEKIMAPINIVRSLKVTKKYFTEDFI